MLTFGPGAVHSRYQRIAFSMGALIMGSDPIDLAVGLGEHMPPESRTPPD
eukprot:gene19279-25918_t